MVANNRDSSEDLN
jgi:hypothetical protein